MTTTNTSFSYFWYIRKKGTRYYLGIVDNNGDAIATGSLDIDLYYDEIPDDLSSQDATMPIPVQFELGFIKGIAAELMSMSNVKSDPINIQLRNQYLREYEDTISEAIHYQIGESQQPLVQKPLDLRDDDNWGRNR